MAEPRDRRGFSLIEAVVALAILAIVLGGALAAAGGTLGVAERGRRDLAMATLAESLLDRVDLDLAVDAAVAEGRAGPFRWRLERTPATTERPGRRPGTRAVALWRIAARIEDGAGASLELATLRLGEVR
jgi:general secretion pathway protein I